jgi:predicted Zn-ribbon and HTH transcriptional regulator
MGKSNKKKKQQQRYNAGNQGVSQPVKGSPEITPPSGEAVEAASETPIASREQLVEELRLLLVRLRDEMDTAGGVAGATRELIAELERVAGLVATSYHQISAERADLVSRKADVLRSEQERDAGFAKERAAFDDEIQRRRIDALSQLETELQQHRSSRLAEVTAAEAAERRRATEQIESERRQWDDERTRQETHLNDQRSEIERLRGVNASIQGELERKRAELERQELDLEESERRVRERARDRSEAIDRELSDLQDAERKSHQSRLDVVTQEAERLRQDLRSQEELTLAFERLQKQLGGRDPSEVITELRDLNQVIARQREELATRPSDGVREQFDHLEKNNRSLANRVEELTRLLDAKDALAAEAQKLKLDNRELESHNRVLGREKKMFEDEAQALDAEIRRLRAAYERPAELEARYREIELVRVDYGHIANEVLGDISEDEWLRDVLKRCTEYGLSFSKRVLWAFHTSLKTAEWSPLTVLAGVSGTGKSELPRLYSHFGGLYYEPLSVQPNWDSQESMLGFFNSIDNRFDAQPILRFLAQSQKPFQDPTGDEPGYPGLKDRVCLVLLDEMNLAHPELYFAEFLSKLELRRGKSGTDVPSISVKIGAGMKPYELKLGRNVMWVGTMNQDETTKSLSDKVLDRSVIIQFPRPTKLKRRQKLTALDASNRGKDLHVRTWQSWLARESAFSHEEIQPYKSFIEEMNGALAVAGRAIGHRVWQSVEFYMANYPDVRTAVELEDIDFKQRAMHTAFEDQLVQKVMPKLRGIDTRGKSRVECLDKIRSQLVKGIGENGFTLAEDFDLATELGYGQFMWQSANYLAKDSDETVSEVDAT